jgi:hypothetical protein
MKTLVAAFITALSVFTLATVWVDMILPSLDSMASAAASYTNSRVAGTASRRLSRRPAPDDAGDEDEEPPRTRVKATRNKKTSRDKDEQNDEVKNRLLAELEQFKQQETKFVEQQNTLKLIEEDLLRTLADVEENRRQKTAALETAERPLLEPDRNPTNVARVSTEAEIPPVRTTMRKAAIERTLADAIERLAVKGNGASATAMLSGLKDREAAKILAIIETRNRNVATRLSNQLQAARLDGIQRF